LVPVKIIPFKNILSPTLRYWF